MNKYIPLTFSLLAASLTPVIANASSATVGYDSYSISGVSLSGFGVSGSLDLTDNVSLEMSTASASTTVSSVKVTASSTALGFGYKQELTDALDLKVIIASVSQGLTASWSGYSAAVDGSATVYGASLTAELTDAVDGMVGFSKSTESGSNMSTMFGISVGVSDSMDLIATASNNNLINSTSLGIKYNF